VRFIFKTSYGQDLGIFRDDVQRNWYLALLVGLLVLPVLIPTYLVDVSLVFIYGLCGVSLMVLAGYTGLVSLGHAAFLGIGAYTHVYAIHDLGLPWIAGVALACVVTAAVGVLVGLPALRMTGVYLSIATLAFALIIQEVLTRWERVTHGLKGRPVDKPVIFGVSLAHDAAELVVAPPLPTSDGDVVVVTDPHYNTLLSHEIVGHPVELDRALKMETAYAGRSWLLAGLGEHQVGKRIASPLVTAYSDPSLPGYGHYEYDHEGTPARKVVHIDRGIFQGFMNSRQTAAIFGGAPNGHFKATEASLVPLIRMSSTVFERGAHDARDIIRDVEHGYYLVGHRIPSIAESRENFRISARKVYEIERGRLGRLYRDGGIAADSRDFLLNVDAVGSDFRIYPIANCGKGQPMQSKKLGNGGPTLRSRARVTGG
jgi:hypothetical protein